MTDELIFVALIVFFTIIESISRSRKKRQQRTHPPGRTTGTEWEEYEPPSTRDEGRYDEPVATADPSEGRGSESMIPEDIWAEIRDIARGSRPEPDRTAPSEPEPEPIAPPEPVHVPERAPREPVARERPRAPKPRPREVHRVHRAHAEYGTDPSSRAPAEQDVIYQPVPHLSGDARAVRSQLRRAGAHGLRQAVVLQEVLGKPMAMRTDDRAD